MTVINCSYRFTENTWNEKSSDQKQDKNRQIKKNELVEKEEKKTHQQHNEFMVLEKKASGHK